MDDDERAAVAELMDEVTFKAGQQIFHERDQGGICYVIRYGTDRAQRHRRGRREARPRRARAGRAVRRALAARRRQPLDHGGGAHRRRGARARAAGVRRHSLRKQPDASLDVLSALAKRIRRADKLLKQRVQDPNELIEGGATLGDRVADTVASFGGSWRFIGLFIGTMALWILWNLVGPLPLRSGAVHAAST